MKTNLYNKFINCYLNNNIQLLSEDFKFALLTEDYAFNPGHPYYTELKENGLEAKGKNYPESGFRIIFSERESNNVDKLFDCNNIEVEDINISFQYGIIYRVSDGMLIACFDFESSQEILNKPLNIKWKDGCLKLSKEN